MSQCSNCDDVLVDPVEQNANYVQSERWGDVEEVTVFYGYVETPRSETWIDRLDARFPDRNREDLAAEAIHPEAEEERDGERFSVPPEMFEMVEVAGPKEAKEIDGIVGVLSRMEERQVPKTALLCSACTKEKDEIIWGVDA